MSWNMEKEKMLQGQNRLNLKTLSSSKSEEDNEK